MEPLAAAQKLLAETIEFLPGPGLEDRDRSQPVTLKQKIENFLLINPPMGNRAPVDSIVITF